MAYYVIATLPTVLNWVPVAPQTLGPFAEAQTACDAANALMNGRRHIVWNCQIIGDADKPAQTTS